MHEMQWKVWQNFLAVCTISQKSFVLYYSLYFVYRNKFISSTVRIILKSVIKPFFGRLYDRVKKFCHFVPFRSSKLSYLIIHGPENAYKVPYPRLFRVKVEIEEPYIYKGRSYDRPEFRKKKKVLS